MDETPPTTDYNDLSPTPPVVAQRPGGGLRWVPLLLAVVWLAASIFIGVRLITDTPPTETAFDVSTPNLTSSAELSAYGGDAYTGIQNAAANTEHAVVDGVNGLATFQLELQKAVAAHEARRAAASQAHLEDGLGFLIIGVAVVNLTIAMTRISRDA